MAEKECLRCIHKEVCKTAESCDGFVSGCEHFVVISNLENTTKQEWISVKDRLPEEDVRVLVWLSDEVDAYTTVRMRIDTDRRHNSRWVRWNRYITHWMPLPQPPKGE